MRLVVLLSVTLLVTAGCSETISHPAPRSPNILEVAELTTEQIRSLDRARTVVLLSGGILEEHGPYLPSNADGYQTEYLAGRVAEAIAARPGWTVLRFPPIPLGAMPANEIGGRYTFPGSYAVRMTTLRAVFMDLATDLGDAGFKWVLVLNYHGGPAHNRALDDASRYFNEIYGGQMLNVAGLVSVAGAAPDDLFSPAQRAAEGFSVHGDADEHSRMLFLRPDLVDKGIAGAVPVVGRTFADLRTLARKDDWPGYFGTPAIANAAAGRRSMDALAAAAIDVVVKTLDGAPTSRLARVWDRLAADPDVKPVIDASLEHDRQVERKQLEWLGR
jgi:creatinine amidohydrolase/Fe(II)-dependent formamide hydrolase-like protein